MPLLLEGRLLLARGRRNVQRAVRRLGPVEALIPDLTKGKSFVDVGALWNVHGKIAFMAEENGASAVTAMDVSPETDAYRAEHERRGSKVRFVQGDLHDDRVLEAVGPHDVVWCSGVFYHAPNPIHTLECLKRLTRETLVLIGATLPEFAGSRQAGVFFPALTDGERRAYDRAYKAVGGGNDAMLIGLTTPFDPAQGYANWWWGLSPSGVRAMLIATGFDVVETKTNGFHTRIVARLA